MVDLRKLGLLQMASLVACESLLGWRRKEKGFALRSCEPPEIKQKEGLQKTKEWLNKVCSLVPVRLNCLDERTVWMLLASEEEADISRSYASSDLMASPFLAVEKWMEVLLGHPPRLC